MYICYDKLWAKLSGIGMKKTELAQVADISSRTLAKLAKNETVSTETVAKLCAALGCDVGDIMQYCDSAEDTLYNAYLKCGVTDGDNENYKISSFEYRERRVKLYVTAQKANKGTEIVCRESGDIVWEQNYHVTGFIGIGNPLKTQSYIIKPEHAKDELCVVVVSGKPSLIKGLDEGIFNSWRHKAEKGGIYVMSEAAFKCFAPDLE